jgi:hypothetical protein
MCVHLQLLAFKYCWSISPPSVQLDLTPSDYHLFTNYKNWLGSWCFNNNEELMAELTGNRLL